MGLSIENLGKGFIGEIEGGWRVFQNGSLSIMDGSSPRLGNINFGARCNSETKFTLDNYLSIRHYFDNPTQQWLTTFDARVTSLDMTVGGKIGRFTATSIASLLNVERTARVDPSGLYQRSWDIPVTEYEILGVTYYVGGNYETVNGQWVFVEKKPTIYDMASQDNHIYLLVNGSHNGEVIICMSIDGIFNSVIPVYSDATDLAGPGGRFLSEGFGYLYVGQVNADRIKRFGVDGTYVTQWGSSGSGNGQFNTISGLAASPLFGDVYVADSVLGRVQRFTTAGAYQNQWGTAGTGSGDTVFNNMNHIAIDPTDGRVWVSDWNARVRRYVGSTGGYLNQPIGSYDFSTGTSTGDLLAGTDVNVVFDSRGDAYAIQLGRVYKYRKMGDWLDADGSAAMYWDTMRYGDSTASQAATGTDGGLIHVAGTMGPVEQYAGSLGRVQEYLLYYIALAAPDIPVRLLVMEEPTDIAYIGWRGNVWQKLANMLAATANGMYLFEDALYFSSRSRTFFRMPNDTEVVPINFDSGQSGRRVEVVNYNSRWTDGIELMYDAALDGGRTFSLDPGDMAYAEVDQNTYPEFLVDPVAADSWPISDGQYLVVDADEAIVPSETWNAYGGWVKAGVSERPGQILLSLHGPGREIPTHPSPYKIASPDGEAALKVTGSGIIANPRVVRVGTGVPETITSRDVAMSVDEPFAFDVDTAQTQASWLAYRYSSPGQEVRITFSINTMPRYSDGVSGTAGISLMLGRIVEIDEAQYVIESSEYDQDQCVCRAVRHTVAGSPDGTGSAPGGSDDIWDGYSAAQFDAYWAGYTAGDFQIAPLRNPFQWTPAVGTEVEPSGGLYPSPSLYPDTVLYPEA